MTRRFKNRQSCGNHTKRQYTGGKKNMTCKVIGRTILESTNKNKNIFVPNDN
jgi:hypothetical protein